MKVTKTLLTVLQIGFIVMAIVEAVCTASAVIDGRDMSEPLSYCVGYLFLSWILELFIRDDDTPVLR